MECLEWAHLLTCSILACRKWSRIDVWHRSILVCHHPPQHTHSHTRTHAHAHIHSTAVLGHLSKQFVSVLQLPNVCFTQSQRVYSLKQSSHQPLSPKLMNHWRGQKQKVDLPSGNIARSVHCYSGGHTLSQPITEQVLKVSHGQKDEGR